MKQREPNSMSDVIARAVVFARALDNGPAGSRVRHLKVDYEWHPMLLS